jgi:hypothetical protein
LYKSRKIEYRGDKIEEYDCKVEKEARKELQVNGIYYQNKD